MPGRKQAKRAPKAASPEVDRRHDAIVTLMLTGQWIRGVTEMKLAAEWGLSHHTVRRMATDASREIRRRAQETPEDVERIRETIIATLEYIRARSLAHGTPQGLRVGLEATLRLGEYMGIAPAQRFEVTETHAERFSGWSVEEKEEFAKTGKPPLRLLAGNDS